MWCYGEEWSEKERRLKRVKGSDGAVNQSDNVLMLNNTNLLVLDTCV